MRAGSLRTRLTLVLAAIPVALALAVVGVTGEGVNHVGAAPAAPTVEPATNPPLPVKCGLSFALVFDLSASITTTQLGQMEQAGIGLAGDLARTASSIGVYTFGTVAPVSPNVNLPAVSLSTEAGVERVQERIRSITRPAGQYTNWQQGLLQVIASGQPHYDAVLFITDGDPTAHGASPTLANGGLSPAPTGPTRASDIDAGVTAANSVKGRTTRVIGVSVTDTVGASRDNMIAISGPTPNSDFFETNFTALRDTLVKAATASCMGTLTVVKEVQAPDGTRSAAGGWTFSATTSHGSVTSPSHGVTGTDGAANFEVDFDGATSSTVTVGEVVQDGYRLLPQTGANAVCTRNGAPVTETEFVNGPGPPGSLFSVPVTTTGVYGCTVVNERIPATLTLVKKVTNISGDAEPDDWTLSASGPTTTTISGSSGSDDVTTVKVVPGTYTLSESGGPPGRPTTPDYRPTPTPAVWVCTGTGFTQPSGTSVALTEDGDATCTLTNTEVPVVKLVQDKTVNTSVAKTGDTLTYTLTVQNVGTGPSGPFTATDTLPSGVTFVSYTASVGTYDDTTGVWTIPTPGLAVDETATLKIIAKVTASPTPGASEVLTNRFEVTPPPGAETTVVDHPCTDDPAQSCAETEVVGPALHPALMQSKTVNLTTAAAGDQLTYTMVVANVGNTSATAVVATDTLPAGVTFVSATPSQGTYDPTTGTWTIGTIPVGGSATLTLVVTVKTTAENTTLTNRFQVTPPSGFPAPEVEYPCSDNPAQSCATTLVPGVPHLTQSKTVDHSTATAGENLTYTMTVGNTGTGPAANRVAQDILPAGVTFVSATPSQGTYDQTTGVWSIGTIPAGGSATLTLVVTVEATAEGTTLTNRFQVDAPPGGETVTVEDPCTDNPTQSCATTVVPGVAVLTQSKVVDELNAAVGSTLTYTATVANSGTAAAPGVIATDTLPAGVTFVSAKPSQGTYDPTTGTWSIGTIPVGGSATLSLVVTVDPAAENTTLINRFVTEQPPNGPPVVVENPCADEPTASCAVTDIPGVPRLKQGKTVDKSTAAVGDTLVYTMTIANIGTGDATDVPATDFLPPGVTLVSSDTHGLGTFTSSSGTWTIPLLPVGTTATLTLTVTIQPAAAGTTLTNQLSVTAPPGSGPTTVDDPCTNDPTRSCATTVVASTPPTTVPPTTTPTTTVPPTTVPPTTVPPTTTPTTTVPPTTVPPTTEPTHPAEIITDIGTPPVKAASGTGSTWRWVRLLGGALLGLLALAGLFVALGRRRSEEGAALHADRRLRRALVAVCAAGLVVGGLVVFTDPAPSSSRPATSSGGSVHRYTAPPGLQPGHTGERPASAGTSSPGGGGPPSARSGPSGETLVIPAIDERAAIVPEGIDTTPGDQGNLAVPLAAQEVGWWDGGPAPGTAGVAVVDGHRVENWAFWDLPDLVPGDAIEVVAADGTTTHWAVTGVEQVLKKDLPSSIWTTGGPPRLALVTCGGTFDYTTGHYYDNVIVWAAPERA